MKEIDPVFQDLQGLTTLVGAQEEKLLCLGMDLSRTLGLKRALFDIEEENETVHQQSGMEWSFEDFILFIKDQGSIARDMLFSLDDKEKKRVFKALAQFGVALVTGITKISGEARSALGDFRHKMPPVTPKELVNVRPGDFVEQAVDSQRERFLSFFTEGDLSTVEDEHRDLCREYERENIFQSAIKAQSIS